MFLYRERQSVCGATVWCAHDWFGEGPYHAYHTNLDRPEIMSRDVLGRAGRVVVRATGFLADARYEDAVNLAKAIHRESVRNLRKRSADAATILSRARSMWKGLPALLSGVGDMPTPALVNKQRRDGLLIKGLYAPLKRYEPRSTDGNSGYRCGTGRRQTRQKMNRLCQNDSEKRPCDWCHARLSSVILDGRTFPRRNEAN